MRHLFPRTRPGPVSGLRWSPPSRNCFRDAQSADSRNRRRRRRGRGELHEPRSGRPNKKAKSRSFATLRSGVRTPMESTVPQLLRGRAERGLQKPEMTGVGLDAFGRKRVTGGLAQDAIQRLPVLSPALQSQKSPADSSGTHRTRTAETGDDRRGVGSVWAEAGDGRLGAGRNSKAAGLKCTVPCHPLQLLPGQPLHLG
jgi:hypothetical protein